MISKIINSIALIGIFGSSMALAGDDHAAIASAESAGPASVTANATIKSGDGTVLREGSNSYTCYPQQEISFCIGIN